MLLLLLLTGCQGMSHCLWQYHSQSWTSDAAPGLLPLLARHVMWLFLTTPAQAAGWLPCSPQDLFSFPPLLPLSHFTSSLSVPLLLFLFLLTSSLSSFSATPSSLALHPPSCSSSPVLPSPLSLPPFPPLPPPPSPLVSLTSITSVSVSPSIYSLSAGSLSLSNSCTKSFFKNVTQWSLFNFLSILFFSSPNFGKICISSLFLIHSTTVRFPSLLLYWNGSFQGCQRPLCCLAGHHLFCPPAWLLENIQFCWPRPPFEILSCSWLSKAILSCFPSFFEPHHLSILCRLFILFTSVFTL